MKQLFILVITFLFTVSFSLNACAQEVQPDPKMAKQQEQVEKAKTKLEKYKQELEKLNEDGKKKREKYAKQNSSGKLSPKDISDASDDLSKNLKKRQKLEKEIAKLEEFIKENENLEP